MADTVAHKKEIEIYKSIYKTKPNWNDFHSLTFETREVSAQTMVKKFRHFCYIDVNVTVRIK